jgi:hypothetical protein
VIRGHTVKGTVVREQHVEFLKRFVGTVKTLRQIVEKQMAQQEMNKEELKFLEEVVQLSIGCGGPRRFTGWYPRLFYGDYTEECMKWDALVADVHTNLPAPKVGDPGCILHQAVGNTDLLIIAIDNGKDRMVYAGPVLSHYEFELPTGVRKTDSRWQEDLRTGNAPPRPEWTRNYLVPGVNPEAAHYGRQQGR